MVAMLLEDMLAAIGHDICAVASCMRDALDAAGRATFDCAILDVNLGGEPSYPIAEILIARGIPFAFATGYGQQGVDERFSDTRVLAKPFASADLEKLIAEITTGL